MKIGRKLRQLRKQKGLTMAQLASLCHFSTGFISNVEHERVNPSIENIKLIADIFEVPYTYFLEDEHSTVFNQIASKGAVRVLELLKDYDEWNSQDQNELIIYLEAKAIIRNKSKSME